MPDRARKLLGPLLGIAALASAVLPVCARPWHLEESSARAERRPARKPGLPRVSSGTVKVVGAIDQAMIEHTIRGQLDAVQRCYAAELLQRPDLTGSLVIQISITPAGQVAASSVQSSTLGSPPVEQCIAAEARKWKFPRPSGGSVVVISCPFTLTTDPTP